MANIIKPSVSDLYYCAIDTVENKIINGCHLLSPPATLIDNSDELIKITGVVRGNEVSMTEFWVNNAVDPNNFIIPGYVPKTSWEELTSNKIDTVLRIDLVYFNEEQPISNFILDLSDPSNGTLNNGENNQYLLALVSLFNGLGLMYTCLFNE